MGFGCSFFKLSDEVLQLFKNKSQDNTLSSQG